ncbi:unnamed protein product [Ilex paraguariensis]|uniref:Pectinesterase inhibitor domain-containing protein n=1 Tax=Ilex paraguariensis TaxID=185542 RepID=A0ABC8V2N5_9AQUA
MRNLISLTSFNVLLHVLLLTILSSLNSCSGILDKKDANLIDSTCKHTPYYQLCVSTLRSNPKSSTADVTGLGLIIVGVVKSKSTQALSSINMFLRSKPELKIPLKNCAESYKVVLTADLPEAVEALTKGDPKFAEDGMNDAAREAQSCESGFSLKKSPLTGLNGAVHDLSVVAASIARMLL